MLLTKLNIPGTAPNLIPRLKLYEKLDEGLNRKLTLVSAPAGFGKSTAISEWIRNRNIDVAWYSIDRRDNDPFEFLSYSIAAVRTIIEEFGKSSLDLLNSPQRPGYDSIANVLINDFQAISRKFCLVLDDFHLINSAEITDLISFFLGHLPANIHLIISTRTDPVLPLARLRSQHLLMELRANDLCFTPQDISLLFNKKLKLRLKEEDIYTLSNKTEGWIAGLQLTALSLQGKDSTSDFIKAFSGDNRYIMDYLIEEVLNNQTKEVKDFLLSTSLLEQFTAPLCNAVLEIKDSQEILEFLERSNMFIVSLDSERKWYRYHHLFTDLLRQRLHTIENEIIQGIHNKAGKWFADHAMPAYAIDHALQAQNYELAAELLDNSVEKMWAYGQHAAILRYGDLLPNEYIEHKIKLTLFYSWVLISSGRPKEAGTLLFLAEKEIVANLLDKPDSKQSKEFLGKISIAIGYYESSIGKTDNNYKYCHQAIDNLTEENPLWYSWAWFSFGVAHIMVGNLSESCKAFKEALKHGIKSENLYLISTTTIRLVYGELRLGNYKYAYSKCTELIQRIEKGGYASMAKNEWSYAGLFAVLGHIQFMWNKQENAIENTSTGYKLSQKGKDVTLQLFNTIIHARVLVYSDQVERAERIINDLDLKLQKHELPPFLTIILVAWKACLNCILEKYEEAQILIEPYIPWIQKETTYSNEIISISYARLLLGQMKISEAEEILLRFQKEAEDNHRLERVIEIKILLSLLNHTLGNTEKWIRFLSDALVIAGNENLVTFFLLEGKPMYIMIKELQSNKSFKNKDFPKEFIRKVLYDFEIRIQKEKAASHEQLLSRRELETLRLIDTDLSNQEIADTLFISLNTVKTHVKNIHLKLEVDSRKNAVSKARELGLI